MMEGPSRCSTSKQEVLPSVPLFSDGLVSLAIGKNVKSIRLACRGVLLGEVVNKDQIQDWKDKQCIYSDHTPLQQPNDE
ncbi:unnamed protein product [Calypogeia fissa]